MGKAVHLEKETRAITAATAGGDQEGLKAPAPTKAENPPVDPKGIGTSDPNSRAGQTLDLIGQNLAVGGLRLGPPLSPNVKHPLPHRRSCAVFFDGNITRSAVDSTP